MFQITYERMILYEKNSYCYKINKEGDDTLTLLFAEVNLNIIKIKSYWDAFIYNEQETETCDVNFLRAVIGNKPKKILEIACGSGRILAPLANDGHTVTGLDCNEYMLSFIQQKLKANNAEFYKADAIVDDWGEGYDVVIEAANLMINIITDGNYANVQRLLIQKAAKALKHNGYLYLDFNLFIHPEHFFDCNIEKEIFSGVDNHGVHGRYSIISSKYFPESKTVRSEIRTTIILPNGDKYTIDDVTVKHIPTLEQVHSWLDEAGLIIEQEYGDYSRNEISEKTCRCIIYARKA